ncbi:MAG: RDD family protein [Bacteroidetes bacterium]|nr:RDD family protein [Bacteroidota bacterium]
MNEIEITTTQNITIHYELAGVGERIMAFILDLIILSLSSLILYGIVNAILSDSSEILVYLIVLPIIVFYSLFFELFNNGQSIGKMALKTRVIRIDGEKTTFTDYLMRWMFRLMDIYGSFGGVAFLGIISSTNNQRTGDLLANTVVVSLKKDNRMKLENLLKLNKQDKYIPVYPEVLRFDEDTMLIVKETLKKQLKYPNAAHKKAFDLLVDKIASELEIKVPKNKVDFLKTLLKDYILLTR